MSSLQRAEGQNRTDDTSIFSAVLYQLSYLGSPIMVVALEMGVKAPEPSRPRGHRAIDGLGEREKNCAGDRGPKACRRTLAHRRIRPPTMRLRRQFCALWCSGVSVK